MPYREKVAWLSMLAMTTVFIPYFTWAKLHPPSPDLPNLSQMGIYASACLAWVTILGIGHLLLRRSSPVEAKLPLDERDRAIQYRSRNVAYGVLMTGIILVGVIMPFNASGWSIANAAIFMIVAAEIAYYGMVVTSYRRQG